MIALASTLPMPAMAQSAFKGFYGQVGVGFENDDLVFSGGTVRNVAYTVPVDDKSQYFGAALSAGGYFATTPKFLVGAGVDYSPFSGVNTPYALAVPSAGVTIDGTYQKKSSYNLFLSPAYAVDKDKLVYSKVGYTSVDIQSTVAKASETATYNGYSLGLGYKQIITGGLFGFAEGNYASYSSKADGEGYSGNHQPTSYNLLVGVGFKF
jgi:outer membrane immunogenic protein